MKQNLRTEDGTRIELYYSEKSVDVAIYGYDTSPGMITWYTHIGGHSEGLPPEQLDDCKPVTHKKALQLDRATINDISDKYGDILEIGESVEEIISDLENEVEELENRVEELRDEVSDLDADKDTLEIKVSDLEDTVYFDKEQQEEDARWEQIRTACN